MSDRAEVTPDAMNEFGNILGRAVTGGGNDLPSSLALVVSRATNRLGGAGYYHDVLGNLVQMPAGVDFVTMSYLDQGHIGTLTDAAGVIWKYYYDADGKRRIKVKTAGGAATRVDAQGNVVFVDDHSFYFYEGEDLICQQDVGGLRSLFRGAPGARRRCDRILAGGKAGPERPAAATGKTSPNRRPRPGAGARSRHHR